MKISTSKKGNVTITDIGKSDLRLMWLAVEAGAYEMDKGGPKSQMTLRLSRLFAAAVQHPTFTICCAPSTQNAEDCYVDLG